MRRSHRLGLIVVVALAWGWVAGSRDLPFLRSLGETRLRVSDSPAQDSPLHEGAARDIDTRVHVSAPRPGVPGRDALELPPRVSGASKEISGPRARPLAADSGALGVEWIGVFAAADEPLVTVAGIDFAAPRRLVLWKIDTLRGHATPVTRLQSAAGRPFVAEHLLLSARGSRLVVAPDGSDPFGSRASTVLEVPARDGNRRKSL